MVALVVQEAACMEVGPATLLTPERPILMTQFLVVPTPTWLSMDPLVVGQLLPKPKGFPTFTAAEVARVCVDAPVVLKGHEV